MAVMVVVMEVTAVTAVMVTGDTEVIRHSNLEF